MTTERGPNETPEERAARIQAAKERALAARAARDRGEAPSTPPAAERQSPEVAAAPPPPPAQPPPPVADDRPRTPSGTLKRDPNAEKAAPPATPEERAARVAAAKAAAAAARAAREAGGGAPPPARPAAAAAPEAEVVAAEPVEAAPAGDGQLRTPKGTLKRDPNAPKTPPPATPEERAARIAAAKAAAAAARERAAAAPPPTTRQPAAGAAAAPAGRQPAAELAAQQAAFAKAFEAVTKPIPSAAEPIPRPVSTRGERAAARAEFPLTEQMEATVAAFREALPDVSFEVLTSPLDPVLVVDRADLYRVMETAKTHPRLDMRLLRCISGVDLMDDGIEVVYHLKSLTTKHSVAIKTLLPPGDATVDSVTPLWLGANWHERELMEMFGVTCVGHPDPRNLLLDEDMTIHPLLKAHPLQDLELRQGVNVF